MAHLSFIADKDLLAAIDKVIRCIEKAEREIDSKFEKNVLDPFSALFDGVTHNMPYAVWMKSEKIRKIQKTVQNAIGNFHQDILGSVFGAKNLGTGEILDVYHAEKKIVAEVKNKFNTTKGNHKTELYDAIQSKLKEKPYSDFVGYYVEVIPSGRKTYNKPFVPSDNKKKKRRPKNEKIRIIDGKSFYALLTGQADALQQLFEVLPVLIAGQLGHQLDKTQLREYNALFGKAFVVK